MKNESGPWEWLKEDMKEFLLEIKQKLTWRLLMRVILCLITLGCAVSGCSYLNNSLGLSDDNIIEEIIEFEIERKTGLDIDLSQGSDEKKYIGKIIDYDY